MFRSHYNYQRFNDEKEQFKKSTYKDLPQEITHIIGRRLIDEKIYEKAITKRIPIDQEKKLITQEKEIKKQLEKYQSEDKSLDNLSLLIDQEIEQKNSSKKIKDLLKQKNIVTEQIQHLKEQEENQIIQKLLERPENLDLTIPSLKREYKNYNSYKYSQKRWQLTFKPVKKGIDCVAGFDTDDSWKGRFGDAMLAHIVCCIPAMITLPFALCCATGDFFFKDRERNKPYNNRKNQIKKAYQEYNDIFVQEGPARQTMK